MPFTFAHPAAILPLKSFKSKWWSWTGLIVGSIIPDFEAIIRLGGDKDFSHSWLGMFLFDFPLGLTTAFVFHLFIRNALIDHIPLFFRKRFERFKSFDWNQYFSKHIFIVLFSLLVGIATHLIWDRITHTDTYTYTEKAGIELGDYYSRTLRIWLQLISTILGLIVIYWKIKSLALIDGIKSKSKIRFWAIVVITAIITIVYRKTYHNYGTDMVNAWIGGITLGVVLASVFSKKTLIKS